MNVEVVDNTEKYSWINFECQETGKVTEVRLYSEHEKREFAINHLSMIEELLVENDYWDDGLLFVENARKYFQGAY